MTQPGKGGIRKIPFHRSGCLFLTTQGGAVFPGDVTGNLMRLKVRGIYRTSISLTCFSGRSVLLIMANMSLIM